MASTLSICPGCGVVAPAARSSCALCNTPFPSPPMAAAGAVGNALWAYISESDFTCRACGLRSPISFRLDGEAECMRCGLRQVFDPKQWQEAIELVHAVADLCGPDVAGRFPDLGWPQGWPNEYASIGVEHAVVDQQNIDRSHGFARNATPSNSVRTRVGPGHPLCHACRTPLDAVPRGGGLETRCPRCGDGATYALPPRAAEFAPRLRGLIGDEFRTDRPTARVAPPDAAGVAAILCPSCGSGLGVGAGSDQATCAYCGTTSRIAPPGWVRSSGASPPFQPFWVLLEGESLVRRQRMAAAAEDAARLRRAPAVAVAPSPAFAPRPRVSPAPGPSPAPAPAPAPYPATAPTSDVTKRVVGAIAFTIGCMVLAGLLGWLLMK